MLSNFLIEHREALIERARSKVLKRRVPLATDYELEHGVPVFLDQLVDTLRAKLSDIPVPEMTSDAIRHGSDLLQQGFTVGQVVHDYGDICQAVTELAYERDAGITVNEFHTLNRCLDNVTADAVTEYGRQRELRSAGAETERLGFFAHELRNLVHSAMLSYEVMRRGAVGIGGSTGAAHERALRNLSSLIDRTLAEVRLESNAQRASRFPLAKLLEDVALPAELQARSRGVDLMVAAPPHEVEVELDQQLVASAVANLLQNAVKFTPPHGTVALRTRTSPDRVLIEVEDECGGLPPGKADELFLPYSQRSTDKSGLGLGLTISRRAVEQSGGTLRVRDLPGKGCVFTVDLPRSRDATARSDRPGIGQANEPHHP